MTQYRERVRTLVFQPYRKGHGPKFRLVMWDENLRDSRGYWITGAQLFEVGNAEPIFSWMGTDGFSNPSAVDSDERVQGIMGFMCCKPGDTDEDYFAQHSQRALEFCANHAESLHCEVIARFGED